MVTLLVIEKYLKNRKITLKKKDDRQKAASFIREESKKIGNLFMRLSHATNPKVYTLKYLTIIIIVHLVHSSIRTIC